MRQERAQEEGWGQPAAALGRPAAGPARPGPCRFSRLQPHPQAPRPLHMPRHLPGTPFPAFTTGLSSYLCSKLQLESHCLREAWPDSLDWVRSGLWPLLAASTSTALARPWEQSLIRTVVPCYAWPSTDALRTGLPWGRTW